MSLSTLWLAGGTEGFAADALAPASAVTQTSGDDRREACAPVEPEVIHAARNSVFSGRLVAGSDQAITGLMVKVSELAKVVAGVEAGPPREVSGRPASTIQMRDPFVLPLPREGRYMLFGTTDKNAWSGPGTGFDCYSSRDLVNWEGPIPAFRPPENFWSNTQFWAPECHAWQGRYYLFASFARDGRQRGTQILAADKPEGPYRLHSDGPVTPREWECLDGTLFVDPAGKPWMVFCHEWVQVGDGEMCAIRLSDDLRSAIGQPAVLFRASEAAWSRPFESQGRKNNQITDGPFLHRLANGKLMMLWSTTGVNGAYVMGYALSDGNILGPWRQSAEAIYEQDGGHGMLFRDFGGRLWMTLHRPNNTPDERPMWIDVTERERKW